MEERLGKKFQGAARGRKGTEGEEGEGRVKASRNHFRYTHKTVKYVFVFLNAFCFWI